MSNNKLQQEVNKVLEKFSENREIEPGEVMLVLRNPELIDSRFCYAFSMSDGKELSDTIERIWRHRQVYKENGKRRRYALMLFLAAVECGGIDAVLGKNASINSWDEIALAAVDVKYLNSDYREKLLVDLCSGIKFQGLTDEELLELI